MHLGSVGLGILARPPVSWLLRLSMRGRLTHGDTALETRVDFLAVVEHRLIPAEVRSEWARLRRKGLAAIWAPAPQESSHVGNAGVGVISMRGALVALCRPLPLVSLGVSLTMVELFGACCLWVLVGSCIWWFCTVIRVPSLMPSSLL